ncbi:MAG: acyltransferase family protein, partial [Polymorphobacter sp.]
MTASASGDSARRYGLDWLRIAAFGLLILYHIGMFFVPWGWHIKSATPVAWLTLPMLGVNAWRLPLLFAISGVASRFLIGKGGNFGRSRSNRLLPALLFGSFVIVAPQAWVDLSVNHGYTRPFSWFYIHDYFSFSDRLGLIVPTWNHLWFVAYLLVYSWVLALVLLLPARIRRALQAGFDRLFAGWRLLLVPLLYFLAGEVILDPLFPETHALVDDWDAHATYFACFAFGVGVARSHRLWRVLDARWPVFAAVALASFAVVAAAELAWPDDRAAPPLAMAA